MCGAPCLPLYAALMTVPFTSPAYDSTVREFRSALADELHAARTRPSSEPIGLVSGRRTARLGDYFHYRFVAEQTLPRALIEDSSADLIVAGERDTVRMVGHEGLDITLASTIDLGERVEHAELLWDMTFLLEELRERLLRRIGENNRGGELLIGARRLPSTFDDASLPGLNAGQAAAVAHALASSCTYLWGPPGTGKTQTIGHLVAELVRRGKSVLLVSHTNVAIDEAILRAAELLGDDLPDGKVLRLGSAYGPRLAERPRLLPATHVKERSADLAEAIASMRIARDAVRVTALDAHRIVELADWLSLTPTRLREIERLERAVDRSVQNLERVEADIAARQAAPTPGRLNVEHDRRRAQQKLQDAYAALRDHIDDVCDMPARHGLLRDTEQMPAIERLTHARSAAESIVRGAAVTEAREQVEALQPRIAMLDRKIDAYGRQIEHLSDELVEEAQVVACTLTAAFLRRAVAGRMYDTVVIDEVSIAPIPSAWYAANLAERAVVAVGDFRQLPPIALANTPLADRWLKRDVFEVSGVRADFEAGTQPSHLLPLTEQHRMAPAISRLPNKLAYRNLLTDAAETTDDTELDGWFDETSGITAPVSVIELASLGTWASTVQRGARTSRLNILSAAVSIDVLERMLHDERAPAGDDRRRALVISPYRPQAELLGAMIRSRGLERDATAGTIHAFQGSEASVVIVDLTVAEPHYRAAVFANEFEEHQRRMLNVAVTRARRRLLLVADRPFIRQHAADGTALRDLSRMLIGCREIKAAEQMRVQDEHVVAEAVGRAEREVVWFVGDVDRHAVLADHVAAAAARGVTACVVTESGRETQIGIRVAALTRLRDAGAVIFVKWPLRESLVVVDRQVVAVRGRGADGWSVWSDTSVAANVVRAHEVPLVVALAGRQAGACNRCGEIIEFGEGDHASPGLYARCMRCGTRPRPVRPAVDQTG
jgi:hypothetical protein